MKKIQKKLIASAVALSALASVAITPVVHAEVSASVAVANMYYWRGLDLGLGDPAVIGDINVSANGFYTGLWASSGDAFLGTEWDYYLGYGFDVGALSVDLNYTTYMYPSVPGGEPLGFDDVSDVAVTLGLSPSDELSFSLMYRHGVGDFLADDNYAYATLSGTYSQFTALVGTHSDDSGAYDGLTHLDLSYAYNDNLKFTLGKVVDQGEAEWDDELKFIVTLSLPLK